MAILTIEQATELDYPAILALNDEAVPAVNSIPESKLAHLHRQSTFLGVARLDERMAGFLLALPETADYDSVNFGYFRSHFDRFVYIDRIVIDPDARGIGLGRRLYEDLQRHVPDGCPLLACEVNLKPPNPESLEFHRRIGFEPVGEQDTEGGRKRVCLMTKRLT